MFCEDSSILNLKVDLSDDRGSIWAATTNTHVNKWAVEGVERNTEEEEEEEVAITDIDDPQPLFTQPLATIPGRLKQYSCFVFFLRVPYKLLVGFKIQVGGA
ncbi:MAG: hypothetical protein MJE68_13335 [Proteobacteria bacterium]|nr:hypothetical protein [Pseudomonadota bacterium]